MVVEAAGYQNGGVCGIVEGDGHVQHSMATVGVVKIEFVWRYLSDVV